ncbi:MAG: zinc-binding dehydrogenase [Anaerolineae bacterium]|nr:zinc-binding dehydrogenase [Anaerolineae bacterium]MDW8173394.1 zinc-binding dehydrogenase [Anaerolineae bacterium]
MPTFHKLVAVRTSDTFREALEVQEVELAPPSQGQLQVAVRYVGVNAADYLMAAGRYLAPTPPPYDMGAEAVGVVSAVGPGVTDFHEGDAVLAVGVPGYRDVLTMSAAQAIPVSQATPEVLTLGVSGLTASIALHEVGQMSRGETVLVTAAAGGTGSFAAQLAKQAGNHVIGTCSSSDKVDFLRSLGVDRPINYKAEDLAAVLKAEYRKGVDLIFEGVGGTTFDRCVDALAVRGRLLIIGAISEYESGPQVVTGPRILYKLLYKSASLRAFWLMHYFRHTRDHMARLLAMLREGTIRAATDPTPFIGLSRAIDAIDYMYQGKNVGKVVVQI